jgi:hypothetical protein
MWKEVLDEFKDTTKIGSIAFIRHEEQRNVAQNVTILEAAIDKGLHPWKGCIHPWKGCIAFM